MSAQALVVPQTMKSEKKIVRAQTVFMHVNEHAMSMKSDACIKKIRNLNSAGVIVAIAKSQSQEQAHALPVAGNSFKSVYALSVDQPSAQHRDTDTVLIAKIETASSDGNKFKKGLNYLRPLLL